MKVHRTGLFVLGLLAIFLAAVGIGSAVEPADTESGGGDHAMEEAHGAHEEPASGPPAGLSLAGEQHTLAGYHFVSGGEFEARPFPAPAQVDSTEEATSFAATFPTAGRYRHYFQFKHGSGVHTAEFTLEVPR